MSIGRRAAVGSRGFTLVELVVVIVLAAIVAGFVVLFLDAPVQAYFQQTGRADLIDSADRITNAVTPDLRVALPNSIRTASNGAQTLWAAEFLQTVGTAQYYAANENPSATGELTYGPPGVASFGTLFPFGPLGNVPYRLSAGNLGPPGTANDAYAAGSQSMTPASTTVRIVGSPPAPAGQNQVQLSPAMTFAASGMTDHNTYLVQGPVSYVCDTRAGAGKGTLTRYWGYAISPVQPLAFPVATPHALIAHDLSTCAFSWRADRPNYRYGQIAIFDITLSKGAESLQVFLQAATEYNQ